MLNISEDLARVQGIDVKKYNLIYLALIGVVVALGVKIVGGLLTAALVAIPAAASRNLSKNLFEYSFLSILFGIFSCTGGIFLAQVFNMPTGTLIILVNTLIFLVSVVLKR